MKAFLDTSSVIKLYHEEKGSDELESYLEDKKERKRGQENYTGQNGDMQTKKNQILP